MEIDQALLRAERSAGMRTAAVRLAYAMHSFPAQGATVHGTATLAGHWSQAKRETYVGDTRAVYRHTVHVAREDLGVDGTDADRTARYAQRIAENRQRVASIRSALDPTLQLSADLPARTPIPGLPEVSSGQRGLEVGTAANASIDTARQSSSRTGRDTPRAAAPASAQTAESARPPDWLLQQLGPLPEERVARERWERDAQRLKALQSGRSQPAPGAQRPAKPSPPLPTRPPGPAPPQQPPPKPGGPTIRR